MNFVAKNFQLIFTLIWNFLVQATFGQRHSEPSFVVPTIFGTRSFSVLSLCDTISFLVLAPLRTIPFWYLIIYGTVPYHVTNLRTEKEIGTEKGWYQK